MFGVQKKWVSPTARGEWDSQGLSREWIVEMLRFLLFMFSASIIFLTIWS